MILLFFIIIGGALILLNTSKGQTWVAAKVLEYVSDKTGAHIQFSNLKIDMYDEISIENFLMQDLQQDTILSASKLYIDISLLEIIRKKIYIDDVILEDARIKFYNTEGAQRNYSFILGTKSQKEPSDTIEKQDVKNTNSLKSKWTEGWQFGINEISVKRFLLTDINSESQSDLIVNTPELYIDMDDIDMQKKCVSLDELYLKSGYIKLGKYKKKEDNDEDTSYFYLRDIGWDLSVKKIAIEDTKFDYNRSKTVTPRSNIDFNNLGLGAINIKGDDLLFENGKISAKIDHISLRERSGFEVEKLSAELELSDEVVKLKNLLVKTPNTLLKDDLELSYDSFDSFNRIVEDVRIKAKLKESKILLKDLAYFIPEKSAKQIAKFLPLDEPIKLNGNISGTIADFRGTKLAIDIGSRTHFAGNVKMKGLPDFSNTFIDLKVTEIVTTMSDLQRIMSGVKLPKEAMQLGDVSIVGNFTGFANDFVADGILESSLGVVRSDLNMKSKGVPRYSGDLSLSQFDVGKLLSNDKLGKADLELKVNGKGLTIKDLDAKIDGHINSLYVNGYNYQNVVLDGRFDSKLFEGKVISEDPNLALNFDGKIDLNNKIPKYEFKSNIIKADLQALKLFKEKVTVTALAEMHISGNDIDNLSGQAFLKNVVFQRGDKQYPLDKLNLDSKVFDDHRELKLVGDFVEANFTGQFSFKELPAAFNEFLSIYFPYNFVKPEKTAPVDFEFDIDVKDPIRFTELFLPELQSLSSAKAKGRFNNVNKIFSAYLDIPSANISQVQLDTIKFTAEAESDRISYTGTVGNIKPNKTLSIPEVKLDGFISDYKINYNLSAGREIDKNRLKSNGALSVIKDTLILDLKKLDLVVSDLLWTANAGKITYLNKQYYSIDEIVLQHEDQFIKVFSHLNDNKGGPVYLEVSDLELKELTSLLGKEQNFMSGVINSKITIDKPLESPVITGKSRLDAFYLMKKEIGDIYINADLDQSGKKVLLTGKVAGLRNQADIDGYYIFDKNKQVLIKNQLSNVNLDVKIHKFALDFLEALLGESNISATDGDAYGNLHLYGKINAPRMDAKLSVDRATTTFNMLNDQFILNNQKIEIRDNRIILDGLVLEDKLGNKAFAKGTLNLNDFKSLYVDAQIDSPNFLFMDTEDRISDSFYGRAMGQGSIMFNGPLNNVYIYVYAVTGPTTHIRLPLGEQAGFTKKNEIYTFVKKTNTDLQADVEKKKSSTKLRLEMDIEMTPDAKMELIFDDAAGDKIESWGSGNVNINYSTEGLFDMYGEYVIDHGQYLFTFQSISNKPFAVNKGGTIRFAGDPYKALLDLTAIYKTKCAGVTLLGSSDTGDNSMNQKFDTEIYMIITDELASPTIEFKINLPEKSAVPDEVERILEGINSDVDKNELNRQVFALLVMGSFFPITSDALLGGSGASFVANNISELLSSQFSRLLNETLSEFMPNSSFQVNWNVYEQQATDATQSLSRNEIELVYTQRFNNDRITIDVGGNVDVGKNETNLQENSIAMAGDFIFQYKITEDGRYRLKIFNKYDEDFIQGRYYKAGVSIFINEDFNNIKELRERQKFRRELRRSKKNNRKGKD